MNKLSNTLQWYSPNPNTDGWDSTRVYRSTSETGTYTLVATITPTTTTSYWDVSGDDNSWYKIAFYDNGTATEGPLSTAFKPASATPTFYCTVWDLRRFMQMSKDDFPSDEDATLLLEQAHVQIVDDAAGITTTSKLKLLALLLGASFVSRSLASRALAKGYISVSLEGGSIMKAHDALMRMSEYYFDKYQQQLAKDTIDYAITSFSGTEDLYTETAQDIKDIMNGTSDLLDYQNSYMPGHYPRSGN